MAEGYSHLIRAGITVEGKDISRTLSCGCNGCLIVFGGIGDHYRELVDHLLPETGEVVALITINAHRDPSAVSSYVDAGGREAGLTYSALAEDDSVLAD